MMLYHGAFFVFGYAKENLSAGGSLFLYERERIMNVNLWGMEQKKQVYPAVMTVLPYILEDIKKEDMGCLV